MPDAGRGTAETEWQNGVLRAARRKLSMGTGGAIERTAAERQTSEAAAGRRTPGLNERRRSTAVANGETKQGREWLDEKAICKIPFSDISLQHGAVLRLDSEGKHG